jgi:hypothetical protein
LLGEGYDELGAATVVIGAKKLLARATRPVDSVGAADWNARANGKAVGPGTGTYRFSLRSVALSTRLSLRCQPATEESPYAANGPFPVSRRSPTAQQLH